MESLKINSISELRDKTIEILNKYTSSSAEIAKALGANFYDEITKGYTDKGDTSTYEVDFSEANDTAVRAMVEKVRQGGSVSAFYGEIMTRVDYLCRRTMNETILEGIKSSGKKMFARVPNGRHTCAFCFMLASRGFKYWTRASAGEFNHYHTNCRCTIVPGDPDADPDTQVEGYKPSELSSRYESCANAVDYDYDKFKELRDSGKTKQTWKQWKLNKLIKEIRTRDTDWLWTGKSPEIGYNPSKELLKVKKHEIITAERLAKHGFKCIFRKDVLENIDGTGRNIGIADLENGIELKTVYGKFEKSTIDTMIKNTNKKRKIRAVVIDNTDQLITDLECEYRILEARNCKVPVYMLSGDIFKLVK